MSNCRNSYHSMRLYFLYHFMIKPRRNSLNYFLVLGFIIFQIYALDIIFEDSSVMGVLLENFFVKSFGHENLTC